MSLPRKSQKLKFGPSKQPVQNSAPKDRIASKPLSQYSSQDQQSGSSEGDLCSGFFTGASHVDASHGSFVDVGRDVVINPENKDNDLLLLDKLPHVKDASYRSGNRDPCLIGTRRDELRRIEDWEADDKNKCVYWLNGVTGTGKSTIAQTFAKLSSARKRLGASFFCSRDFDNRCDINLIFPTIAYDLACQYPTFKAALVETLKSTPNAGHETLALQLESLLVRPLQSTGLSTTIIIDALDECKDKLPASAILSLLGRHVDAMPRVKFFITGRPEIPIRAGFRLPLLRPHAEVFVLHDVDRTSVDEDIKLYLRVRLSEIAAQRSDCDVDVIWPTNEEISAAATKCSGIFVVASIIVRFVIFPNHTPQDRLKIIISRPDSTVNEGKSGLDETYDQIFLQGFEDVEIDDTDFFSRLRLVLGSIVLSFNPLSYVDLAAILNVPQNSIRSSIRSLHSVLIVPESNSHPPRVCHKSFPDYLTNRTRCTNPRFQIDPSVCHLKLGTCCLALMNRVLKRNICNLPAYAMNSEVCDLGERQEKYIGSGLEYACRSWARHLGMASRDVEEVRYTIDLLETFLKHQLLSWLEVLSILGDLRCAVYTLRDVKAWLAEIGWSDADLSAIMKDSERFVLRFFDVIEASAVHIYYSALPWCPATSRIRMLYQDHILMQVNLLNPIDRAWDACTRVIETRDRASPIAYSHKDDLIAVCEEGCVENYEVSTGQHHATLARNENTAGRHSVAFSPDNTLIVAGCADGIIDFWDLQTGSLVCALKGHTHSVESIAFSACGTMIASCSSDLTVRIWDISSYDCRCVLRGHSHEVTSVCWLAAGREVVSGSRDGSVRVWDVVEMNCLKTFTGHHSTAVLSVACSPDSSWIASGSWGGTVKIIDVRTGGIFQTISEDNSITSIRFLTPEHVMYTMISTFAVWDITKNADVLLFGYDKLGQAISSDGTSIVSSNDGFVKLWQTDIPNWNHDQDSHIDKVQCVAFSGDGQLVASGSSDGTVKLWDPTSGLCLHTFLVNSNIVLVDFVAFSPDSRFCASSSLDNTIRIWDVHTRTLFSSIYTASHALRFSPDGCQLVSSGYRPLPPQDPICHVTLWEVRTGKLLAGMDVDHFLPDIAFGVDGTSVILQSDGTVNRWQISPSPSYSNNFSNNNNVSDHSSLPMVFVPMHDNERQQSTPPAVAPLHYRYDRRSGWILDKQGRQILWIPSDRRGYVDQHGKKLVFGSDRRKVTFIDFSDEQVGHPV